MCMVEVLSSIEHNTSHLLWIGWSRGEEGVIRHDPSTLRHRLYECNVSRLVKVTAHEWGRRDSCHLDDRSQSALMSAKYEREILHVRRDLPSVHLVNPLPLGHD